LFYSGDFRAHGRKAKVTEQLIAHPPAGVDVLLLEGSSLGRLDADRQFPTEVKIEERLVRIFNKAKGIGLVHASAQNLDRFVSVFRACKRTGRKLIIDLYTAVILEATGNKNIPQSDWPEICVFIPQSQRIKIKKKGWFGLLKHHSKNRIFIETLHGMLDKAVLFFRPIYMGDLEKADCLNGAVYIYSQYEGYWEEDSYARLRAWIKRTNIRKINVHTSGHACLTDLKRLAKSLQPKTIIPVHTFSPERYKEYFGETVHCLNDGEPFTV